MPGRQDTTRTTGTPAPRVAATWADRPLRSSFLPELIADQRPRGRIDGPETQRSSTGERMREAAGVGQDPVPAPGSGPAGSRRLDTVEDADDPMMAPRLRGPETSGPSGSELRPAWIARIPRCRGGQTPVLDVLVAPDDQLRPRLSDGQGFHRCGRQPYRVRVSLFHPTSGVLVDGGSVREDGP
jgi:hypothetical protein